MFAKYRVFIIMAAVLALFALVSCSTPEATPQVVEVVREVPVVTVVEKIVEVEKPVYIQVEKIIETEVPVDREVVKEIIREVPVLGDCN